MAIRRVFLVFGLSILLGATMINTAAVHAAPDFSAIDATVNQLLAMYSVPGAAIGIVQNGQVVYTKGYGYADAEHKTPVTEQTVFSIGSVSKSFTVLDLAQLAEAGKVDLDAPVIRYLPDFKLSDPDATKALTIRQVLSHSTGLPRADDRLVLGLTSRKQIVADMVNISLTGKPGQVWQYCNQNFVLAGYLIEQVSGQTWEQYTQQHIFDPLGLKSATFGVDAIQGAPDHAQPYLSDTLKGYALMPYSDLQKQVIDLIGPAGSINANVLDMSQYALFQLSDGTFNGKSIVPKAVLDQMHTRQISVAGKPEGDALIQISLTKDIGYGMGWFTETYQGHNVFHHGGEVAGYTSDVTLAPDDKLGIVILSNISTSIIFTEALRMSLLQTLLSVTPAQDVVGLINKNFNFDPVQFKQNVALAQTYKADPAALDKLVGSYTGIAGTITISNLNGTLYLDLGIQHVALIPFKDDTFLASGTNGITISFKSDSGGTLNIYQDATAIGKRVAAGTATTYTDPKSHFTTTLPNGIAVQQVGDLGVIQVTNPTGTYVLATADAGSTDLQTEVTQWLIKYAQITVDQKPTSVRAIPLTGTQWTQYLYTLPGDQLLAVVATLQGKTVYFLSMKGATADIGTLSPTLNTILLNFKFTP